MEVLRGVWRRKLMIAAVGLAALAAGVGAVNVMRPVYSTESQVLIQDLETPFDRVQPPDNQRADTIDDRIVASQIAVLQSEDLGRRVVASLSLDQKPEFNPLIKGLGSVSQIKLMLGFGEDPRQKTPEQRALGRYLSELSAYQVPNSNVVAIKFSSHDPQTAADVANMLAETYVLWTRESQAKPTERARDWLAAQIAELRAKLARSEEAVERFRSEAGLLQGATTTLGTQEISELNSQITVARSASSEARAKAENIRELLKSGGGVDSSADVLASAAVQRLKEQRGEAVRRAAELSATYLSNHPRMIAANKEIASLDRQLRAEALKVVESLEEQARVAEARETSLRASLEKLKTAESTANLDDVKLKALEREVTADRALLETLLSRYAEASARQDQATQPGTARVIQTAGVPTSPSFPKSGPLVVLITIAGFSVALGLAFLMELMAAAARLTDRINEAAAQEASGRLEPAMSMAAASPPPAPVPATMPMATPAMPAANMAPAHVPPPPVAPPAWQPPPIPQLPQHLAQLPRTLNAADAPMAVALPAVMAAAQALNDWIPRVPASGSGRRIGITSLGGSTADTSVLAAAMARSMANAGKRAALVDLSRSGSAIEAICGAPAGPGLAELVTGAVDFTKVIARDVRSPLHLLRYGADRGPGTASLILDRADSVLAALAQSYEAVIVNLGEAQQETPALLHKCDGALIAAPAQRYADVTSAIQALLSSGMHAASHVLIVAPETASGVPDFSLKSA